MRKLLLAVLMSLGLAHQSYAFGPNPQANPWSEDSGYRIWARPEYMLWWFRSAPLPPLVTTGTTGILGAPDTQVLLGDNTSLGTFNGGKLSMGFWFDQNGVFGIEGDLFLTEQRGSSFSATNDGTGVNGLFMPFSDVNPILPVIPTESVINIALPGITSGTVSVTSSARLWGSSADFALTPYRDEFLEVVLLGGFRYLDLDEDLNLYGSTGTFGVTATANDHFGTRNQFYGGELGARATFKFDALFVQLGGKCALGANSQTSVIEGSNFNPFIGTTPGGLFAQPTNIGTREQNDFSVLPSAQVRVGFDVSTQLRVMMGYDFLYWSDVIRPGTQIDRTINTSQVLGGALTGEARPAFNFVNTDFFAHGVSFGFELRF